MKHNPIPYHGYQVYHEYQFYLSKHGGEFHDPKITGSEVGRRMELISAVKNDVPSYWTPSRVSTVERFLSELAIQLEMKIQLTIFD